MSGAKAFLMILTGVLGIGSDGAEPATRPACVLVHPAAPRPRPGDYLATSFQDELVRTLSPRAAADTTTLPLARVQATDSGIEIITGSWHDGAGQVHISNQGMASGGTAGGGACAIALIDDSHFAITDGEHASLAEYTYVGEVDTWVAGLLFVGRYFDLDGGEFVFRPDGQAVIKGKSVAYSLVDPDGNAWEAGRLILDGAVFRFDRRRDALLLFGPIDESDVAPDAPAYALRPVEHVR